jgi:hypothetical protein
MLEICPDAAVLASGKSREHHQHLQHLQQNRFLDFHDASQTIRIFGTDY